MRKNDFHHIKNECLLFYLEFIKISLNRLFKKFISPSLLKLFQDASD
jgi:hypothetical protein